MIGSQLERTISAIRLGCVPRFYLHLCNGNGFTEDEEGREFEMQKMHIAKLCEDCAMCWQAN